jgi:hypothetical protein
VIDMVEKRVWKKVQNNFRLLKEKIVILEKTVEHSGELVTNPSELEQGVLVVLAMIDDLKKINENLVEARETLIRA